MTRTKYLADEVPWISMLPHEDRPRVVACSNFGWLMSAAFSPPDMSTATPKQRFAQAARSCLALQTLQGGRWIWIEERRDPLAGVRIERPANRAARLYASDREAVHARGVHHASSHFVSVRHNPPSGLAQWIRNAVLLPEEDETEGQYGVQFDEFVRDFHRMTNLLRGMSPRVLDGNDLASYLRSTISVNCAPVDIDCYDFITPQLLDSSLFGNKRLWLGKEHNKLNVRCVQINSYPHSIAAGAMDFGTDEMEGLSELGFRVRRVKRIRTASRRESVSELEWLIRKAAGTQESMLLTILREFKKDLSSPLENKTSVMTLQEADEMLIELYKGGVLRCQTTDNILVYDEDPVTARKNAEGVEEFLIGKGFGVQINDVSNHDCVLGAIPGKTDVDFVRPTVNLLQAAVTLPLTKSWSGTATAKHPAVMFGTTGRNNRFELSFGNLHGFVCGGSGSGKSSALNGVGFGHLTVVPGGRVIRVESGRSGYVMALLVGGVTFNIGEPGCGVQPYRDIVKLQDRAWAHAWTIARIRHQLGERGNAPEISQAVEDALRQMARMNPDDRTISTFCLIVPNEDAARAMRLYSSAGSLGHIFDCVDKRSYNATWINFELSAITEDAESIAAPALIQYLWRLSIRQSSAKRPLMLQLDEASTYVEGDFITGLEKGLRRYRKMKTQVIFATQSIIDLADTKISHLILNSCPTQIYVQDRAVVMPNGLKVLEVQGLTEEDAETIANMTQAQDYFVYRVGVGKAVVSFDFNTPIAANSVLMTDDEHYQQAREVERMPGNFLDNWMMERDGIEVAELLGESRPSRRRRRAETPLAVAAE